MFPLRHLPLPTARLRQANFPLTSNYKYIKLYMKLKIKYIEKFYEQPEPKFIFNEVII